MRSSTRMDVLSTALAMDSNIEKKASGKDDSPRDSLSPLDERFSAAGVPKCGADIPRRTSSRESAPEYSHGTTTPLPPNYLQRKATSSSTTSSNASNREAQTQPIPHITFQDATPTCKAAAATRQTNDACSPRSQTPLITRSHQPKQLTLTKTNGLTTITTAQLKQRICDGHTASSATETIAQVPRPKLPKTPGAHTDVPQTVPMGNSHSGLVGSTEPGADNASLNSVVRRPLRILRKSSTNLFKRLDSQTPLPRPHTATSIAVQEKKQSPDVESPLDPFNDPPYKARDSMILLPGHSTSTMTMTDESAAQPLSASSTVKDVRETSSSSPYISVEEADEGAHNNGSSSPPPVPEHRASALSPTIPAPSPVPEDSPHKYGLKDRYTPEAVVKEPVRDIDVQKMIRRSSGLEIFNEAKSLQHASSFLNGLSTARRRAESTNATTDTWTTTLTGSTSRPPSARPGSARPSSRHANGYDDGRRRGHNFKSNGFAYARSLGITQLKCYRQHARLLMSRNKQAAVECGICHTDDELEHWTCSWCAVRMCRFCRKDFAERGMAALKERIKLAEMGQDESPSSSDESLATRAGRSRPFM